MQPCVDFSSLKVTLPYSTVPLKTGVEVLTGHRQSPSSLQNVPLTLLSQSSCGLLDIKAARKYLQIYAKLEIWSKAACVGLVGKKKMLRSMWNPLLRSWDGLTSEQSKWRFDILTVKCDSFKMGVGVGWQLGPGSEVCRSECFSLSEENTTSLQKETDILYTVILKRVQKMRLLNSVMEFPVLLLCAPSTTITISPPSQILPAWSLTNPGADQSVLSQLCRAVVLAATTQEHGRDWPTCSCTFPHAPHKKIDVRVGVDAVILHCHCLHYFIRFSLIFVYIYYTFLLLQLFQYCYL